MQKQNTSAHASQWDVQNILLDQCLAEEEDEEEEYVNDDMNVGTATISCTWATSNNESGGSGSGSGSLFPNPATGSVRRRRSRTSRASSRKTTLVKANPANFRDLVQHFTGCHSRLPYPPVSLQGKGPINLNFAHYTTTTSPTPTPTPITYHPTNISTSSHRPPTLPGFQQQQGSHYPDRLNFQSFPTADNNNNINVVNDGSVTATDHPQYPPPPSPFTSFSSHHDEMEVITQGQGQGQFTMWETDDQHHYY